MSKSDFHKFIPEMGTHRLYGMTPQSFIDTMPERRWTRRDAAMAAINSNPFKGITTDGEAVKDLFSLRPEGAPTEAILNAVSALLKRVTPEQRTSLMQPIESKMRNSWQNGIPDYETVNGLRMDEVSEDVRAAAMAVLDASLSARGYERMRNVMRLNGYLGELVGAPKLLGEWCYRLHFFGTPSATEPWGWQFAGHHLCLTCFILGTQMTMTPTFMGVEPNCATEGQFAGASVFEDEEYHGLQFARSLNTVQKQKAILYDTILADGLPPGRHHQFDGLTLGGAYQDNRIVPYEGIAGADLDAEQRRDLLDLAERYLSTLPEGPLKARMEDLERHIAETRFCWAGGLEEESVFYYRIQSPVVMIEFDHHWGVVLDNPKPEKFHIHTVIRTPNGNDYGMDLLRLHYETAHHHQHHDHDHVHDHDHNHDHHHSDRDE